MSSQHWAADYFPQIESMTENTGWDFTRPSSERGPVVCNHEDGSELSWTDSRGRTGTLRVEYQPADGTRAFNEDGISFGDPDNAMEMFEHILTKHARDNE